MLRYAMLIGVHAMPYQTRPCYANFPYLAVPFVVYMYICLSFPIFPVRAPLPELSFYVPDHLATT
jgi:hypothetical protein